MDHGRSLSGVFYAGRICHGGDRIYKSEKLRKHSDEEYDGFLHWHPVLLAHRLRPKVEVIVSRISVDAVVEAAKKALYTGHIGDGKIFVYNVTRVVKIRTGEENYAALQDVE